MKKLSRAQIKEGFESIPMDTLLLGATTSKKTKLTHKQREFAREIAMGETKAGAYRKAYKSKGKPQTQSIEGQKLMKNPAIALQAEAISLALESAKYTTPAHLRALAIHKITEKALDPDVPPAQQLKALELLGKITEVSLFTHRVETIQTTSSADMKEKLMESIRMAISNSKAIDVEAHNADDLLAEIARGKDDSELVSYSELADSNEEMVDQVIVAQNQDDQVWVEGFENGEFSTPLSPDPQFSALPQSANLHSIPDIRSESDPVLTPTLTGVNLESPLESTTSPSSNKNPNGGEGI